MVRSAHPTLRGLTLRAKEVGERLETATRWWLSHLTRGPWQVVAWTVVLCVLLVGWAIGLSI